jgi:ppGpp synthetase/RelA/SpoT-type nucleotidyltranferase
MQAAGEDTNGDAKMPRDKASMANELTKTQIDRLGDRLKKGHITEADLRLLDQYRRSFTPAYEIIVGTIRQDLALEPTGRPAKSTTSISDKLRRESIRLTQIQDIAGCRLTVTDIAEQDSVVQSLTKLFEQTTIVDRRERPSHGYRAVHVIVSCLDKMIEVQVRTSLQHLWAELSEKISDMIDPAIKYGAGNERARTILTYTSEMVVGMELAEAKLAETKSRLLSANKLTGVNKQRIADIEELHRSKRQEVSKKLRVSIEFMKYLKEHINDIPD